jgi:short-subunit dehydrogenase
MYWKDKVVLITGASSGIGEALAFYIARKNPSAVCLLARREEELIRVAKRCEELGTPTRYFACDVTDAPAVKNAAELVRTEFGRIDTMIANAGIAGRTDRDSSFSPEMVGKVIDINLMGAVNSIAAVLPEMLTRGSGHLVAISSLAGFRGLPRSAAYSASKAAMTAYFESIRLDVQHRGVDVSIIQPGFIKTPLTSGRKNKMPYLMELDAAVEKIALAIENKKKFAAFPWQLALLVKAGRFFPVWLYDRIAGRATYRV